ncbi:hypothetical protein WR25_11709 [Diploscapter pachys]|uniref:Uncharacterized protein n=1 Tax=Diploscapter pachys TaxID=2018661 RepID=A0A2A2KPE0_9BILA|nr:hypothetical protein WR25_11709 [Diploscapter pachys]
MVGRAFAIRRRQSVAFPNVHRAAGILPTSSAVTTTSAASGSGSGSVSANQTPIRRRASQRRRRSSTQSRISKRTRESSGGGTSDAANSRPSIDFATAVLQAARRASQYGGRVPPSLTSAADPSISEAAPSESRHKRRRTSGDGDADRSASASSSSVYNSCEETDRRYNSPLRRRSVR